MIDTQRALVLFSGGQDSTTCLAWALDQFERVETVGFDYGQRHKVELACRQEILPRIRSEFPKWGTRLGDDHVLDIGVLGEISNTALTRDAEIRFGNDGLPSTFVPARNLLFLALACAIAYRRNLNVLVGGMCETDFSGYPDCRDETMKAMQNALTLGTNRPFRIDTPLMWLGKGETWSLAHSLGGDKLVSIIIEHSHTCYVGNRSMRHEWGYGCGECPACSLRRSGYTHWQSRA